MKTYKAFTLIELILVIAIVAVLAGAMIPAITSARQEARAAQIMKTWQTLSDAAKLYYSDTGQLASEVPSWGPPWNNLSRDSGKPGWDGPYIDAPLTNSDNPYGGEIFIHYKIVRRSTGRTHLYSQFMMAGIPESAARKINDALDTNESGAWNSTGRVTFSQATENLWIHQPINTYDTP